VTGGQLSSAAAAFLTSEELGTIANYQGYTLDADGNGTADALSDGILILRYLFDATGAWNVDDALGSGATRTSREDIKGFLDDSRATALDADGNGTADALSDGILILRYLFDRTGAWNVNDALGAGATRTTREAIKAYLDGFNPGVSPPPGLMAETLAEEPGSRSLIPAIVPTEESAARSSIAAIAPAVLIGDPGTIAAVDREDLTLDTTTSSSNDAPSAPVVRAVDATLAQWDGRVAPEEEIDRLRAPLGSSQTDDAETLDQLWGEGGLEWFVGGKNGSIMPNTVK
jgi:hypothetical protein